MSAKSLVLGGIVSARFDLSKRTLGIIMAFGVGTLISAISYELILVIALICSASSVAGYSLFKNTSSEWLAFIQAFAGGAILLMLANSMIPESYEHSGKIAGIFTVLGFFVSVSMVILEHTV